MNWVKLVFFRGCFVSWRAFYMGEATRKMGEENWFLVPVLNVFSRYQSSWIKTLLEKSDLFLRVSKGGSQESCNEAPPSIPGKVFLAQLLNTMPLWKLARIHFVSKYQILLCVFADPALSGFSLQVAEYCEVTHSYEHFSAFLWHSCQ